MSPVSAANLKKNLFKYLDRTIDENEVLSVSTQKGNIVILNAGRYYEETMSETERLEELEAIRQGDEDIANGRFSAAADVFARLEARNNEMLKKAGYNV